MRRFSGSGGKLFAVGDPFAFTGAPLDDCGDGFTWKAADSSLRCWTDVHSFEVFEHGLWRPVAAESVDVQAATVSFGRCLIGLHVRVSGVALTAALIGEGESWTLEQAVAKDVTLSGHAFGLGSTTATVVGGTAEDVLRACVQKVMAVLPSAPAGAFVGFGEPDPGVSGVRVLFDSEGVTYAHG